MLDGITDSMDMDLGELQELTMDGEAGRAAVHEIGSTRLNSSHTLASRMPSSA